MNTRAYVSPESGQSYRTAASTIGTPMGVNAGENAPTVAVQPLRLIMKQFVPQTAMFAWESSSVHDPLSLSLGL